MKNFKRMKDSIDVSPFIKELFDFGSYWSDARAKLIPVHRDTLSLALRWPVMLSNNEDIRDVQTEVKTKYYDSFPVLTAFLEKFAEEINGQLARVNIVSLKKESQVYAHIDTGTYY